MGWILDYWKEQFEKGKTKGIETKKKHKRKLKKLIGNDNDE